MLTVSIASLKKSGDRERQHFSLNFEIFGDLDEKFFNIAVAKSISLLNQLKQEPLTTEQIVAVSSQVN